MKFFPVGFHTPIFQTQLTSNYTAAAAAAECWPRTTTPPPCRPSCNWNLPTTRLLNHPYIMCRGLAEKEKKEKKKKKGIIIQHTELPNSRYLYVFHQRHWGWTIRISPFPTSQAPLNLNAVVQGAKLAGPNL